MVKTMSYKLNAIETTEFLRLELSGLLTEDVSKEIVDKVAASLVDSRHDKVLLDVRNLYRLTGE